MTRDNDFLSREIETTITAMLGGISKKDTRSGTRGKFVRGIEVWITQTPKNA